MGSGAVTISACSWFRVWVLALCAERCTICKARQPFHGSVVGLRDHRGLVTDHCPGGSDSVDHVGLAVRAAHLPVRPAHLNHLDLLRGQMPGQPGTVGPGALHPDGLNLAEAGQEGQQVAVAGRGGRERLRAKHLAQPVTRGGDVDVGVGVHTADDNLRGQCHSGHAGPLSADE